jgi:hypothetical protein
LKPSKPLKWDEVKKLIFDGTIETIQIGTSPMWVTLKKYPPLKIEPFTILVPNITRGIVMRLFDIHALVRQQDHIIEDGYSQGELPELEDIFATLIRLGQVYGTSARLDLSTRKKVAFELRQLMARIENSPVVKLSTRQNINLALAKVIRAVENGNIRGTIASTIRVLFTRLDEIGSIIPAIDHRRRAALEEICRLERVLWLYAYKAGTFRMALKSRNLRAGIMRYLKEEAENLPYLGYRQKVTKAKRIICLAIGAIDMGRETTTEKLINRAIEALGFSPINLTPIKAIV